MSLDAAIVGVGATPYYFRGESEPQTLYELIGKAILAVVADAGLNVEDVDGFAFYASGFEPGLITEMLGIPQINFASTIAAQGGGSAAHAERTKFTLHCLSSHSCEIDGDHAHAETYYLYNANNRDGTNWSAAGRYLDRFERRGGAWRIAFRCITVEWSDKLLENAIPMFDELTQDPDVLRPSRDLADPSYRRPMGG